MRKKPSSWGTFPVGLPIITYPNVRHLDVLPQRGHREVRRTALLARVALFADVGVQQQVPVEIRLLVEHLRAVLARETFFCKEAQCLVFLRLKKKKLLLTIFVGPRHVLVQLDVGRKDGPARLADHPLGLVARLLDVLLQILLVVEDDPARAAAVLVRFWKEILVSSLPASLQFYNILLLFCSCIFILLIKCPCTWT